ncbi:hypothetical protein D3C84_900060 [compost metagenome]
MATNVDFLDQGADIVKRQPVHDQLPFSVLDGGQGRPLQGAEITDGKLRQGHGSGFHHTTSDPRSRATRYTPGNRERQVQVIRKVVGINRMISEQLRSQALAGIAAQVQHIVERRSALRLGLGQGKFEQCALVGEAVSWRSPQYAWRRCDARSTLDGVAFDKPLRRVAQGGKDLLHLCNVCQPRVAQALH